MNENFTKINCRPADDKFTVLFLRDRKISKEDLNLRASRGKTFAIWNHSIKSSLISTYQDFKQSNLDLSDYFGVNIIYAVSRRSNDFNLRETRFDESKKVNLDKEKLVFLVFFRLKLSFVMSMDTVFMKPIYLL